ncbi:cytochrome P450 [Ophiobolus disseminans]|uniref:Cytochrome P450 n=1 Tax=Ophiobolus disseminans TaxID=1469910 RepID=A0A6A6ZKE5_9PLEO|nr:cytochrome P450 [Ophiobolus disseminans]
MIEHVLALLGLYVGWAFICLELNHKRASVMRIPLVRVPIDPLNLFFMVLEPHIFRIIDLLPPSILPNFVQYMRRGWFFLDKADAHLKYGPMWASVTPRGIHIQICDSEAIHDMFNRRYDFIRPSENYKLLEVYGPCISTADLGNWPRHRKVLAAPFNESVMKFVWDESLSQAEQMIRSWTLSTTGIQSFSKDARTLSLNVLAATGFRRSFSFQSASDEVGEGDAAASYRDALSTVLDSAVLLMLIPYRYLSLPFFPKSLQSVGKAGAVFKHHMERMLHEETEALGRGEQGAGSLMTAFVRALNTSGAGNDSSGLSKGLSVDEIYGNIFVINFAGHDTTANTLAFSMALLATQPEVQEWIADEVRRVVADGADDWEYADIYPQLIRFGDRTIIVPANTSISPSLLAVHTHPKYWPNPLAWKPTRWLTKVDGKDCLVTPARDTYFPWSDGPQNCPGRKFSEVEFVAVLALLMRNLALSIVKSGGEAEEMGRKRAMDVVDDCDMQLLLRMRDADQLKLRCEMRI